MSASTILTSKRGFVRSSAFLAASLAFAAALPMAAVAGTDKTNPVTGETETYTWKFVGTDTWGQTQYWQDSGSNPPSGVPAKTSDNTWDPILFDGNTININDADLSVEGWNLRMGLYNGATVTIHNLVKYQGDTTMWATVDESSQLTIGGFGGGNITANQVIKLSVAKANGITWTANLTSGNANNTFEYYLKGAGSVSYQAVTAANHKIKMADVTLTGTSQVSHKTLVSFTSAPAFTADASIKVLNGSTVVATKALTAVNTTATLTTDNAVGTCELVQTSTGIDLYWVDGDPAALTPTVYKPSININFTHGGVGLTTAADVGAGEYAVPGTSWSNMAGSNGSSSTIYGVDSTGEKSLVAGASVTVSGAYGSYRYTGVDGNVDLRYGYIDDAQGTATPQVVVDGIPYYKYQLVLYFSNDTNGRPFGHLTINRTNYKWDSTEGAIVTCEGTVSDVWGSSSGTALTEGGNYLVFPAMENPDGKLTIVGHRWSSTQRMGVAAIQIVEVRPDAGENDLVIEVSGDTEYTVAETKDDVGTVYITGNGTLTLAGEAKISAATIDLGPLVTLNVNADRLDADTFTGGGTVVYDGATPGLKGWADSAWTGTVWIKNVGSSGSLAALGHTADSTSTNPVNSWGNEYSFVKFTNVYGYMSGASCPWTLILEDDGDNKAWYDNDGWSGRAITIGGLKGSGTFYDVGNKKCRQNIKFTDASAFTGSIHVEGKRIGLGGTATVTGDSESLAGVIEVVSGKTAALASGQTWYAGYRIAVNGTLTGSGTLDSGNTSVAISGSGTVVFDGKAPSPTGDLWWKNAAWTGTVEIKNITDMIGRTSGYTGTYLDFNSYGNADSLIKLGTLTGWMDNYTCNVPVNLAGTLTINNGVSGETFTFKKLISDGGYITATDQSATFSIRIEDGSEYAGYIGLNSKRVIFGTGTAPTFVKGQIYVSSDATITVPSVNTAYWAVGSILVDGELKADNLNRFGGGTNITTGDDGVFTLTSTGNGSEGETDTDYARIKGTGSLKYDGTGWRALSTNNFPTAVTLVNEQVGDILLSRALTYTIGSLSGSKNFQGNYGSGNRYLNVIQSKDTEWSGKVVNDGSSRFAGLKLDASSTGTLTLSGTASQNVALEVNGGAVNLTGTWKGATTVAGTIGGTGTLTGNLTFNDGATFKAAATALAVSETVTFPTAEGESVTVDLSGITPDVSGTTLITAGSINDISKLSVSGALLALENDDTVLKAYPIATLTYTENETTTTIACSSVQDAVNQAYARECQNKTYDYIAVYASANVTAYSATVKVKLANDATFTIAPASPEYGAYSAGSAGEDGVVTYTSATNPTTYTWVGAQEGIWAAAVNWQYGESSSASRYPVAGDTVIINDGATISISGDFAVAGVQVGGAATINGSGTLTAESDGIVLTDADASISVGSVTLSPLPTTTVENAKVKSATAAGVTTYFVAFVYTLTLDGTATTWSGGTWTCNNQETDAPTSGYVEIVAMASTELTVDTAVSLVDLNVGGGEDIVVNIATNDTGSLYSSKVTIENGVFQQGSPAVLGATPSIIVEDGATFDMNGLGINAATKVYLAGAGAGSWPWALTSSSGAGGAILGGLYLTDDATIGGANELKIGQYSLNTAYHCYLQGHTMTKIGEGALTGNNMNTPDIGTIDVYGGAMSVNSYNNLNNLGGDTTVILHTGASLANGTDRIVPMGTLKLLGGTLTTARAFKVKTLLTGSGETANLAFAGGASASLTGDLTVTAALTLDGAMAFSKDENAANDVVVTASGTMSSSGAISVGAGVTLNLGTNRPAGVLTVAEGGTLAVKMADAWDVVELVASAQPSSVVLYGYDGAVIDNKRVTFDDGVLTIAKALPTLRAGASTSFDTPANWVDSTMPSGSGDAIIEVSADSTITVAYTYALGDLTISGNGVVTFAGDGKISANNIYLKNSATLVRNANISATTGISIDSGTVLRLNGVTEAVTISGAGRVETCGDVVFTANNTFTGGLTVKSGTTSTTAPGGFAGIMSDGIISVSVEDGGCLDIANTKDYTHSLTIAGKGVLLPNGTYSGAVKNSGNVAFGLGNRQARSITLSADAMVDVSTGWGIVRNGYNDAALVLNGHTLTMRGTGTVPMSTVNASSPSGTLVLDGATLYLGKNASNLAGVNIIARGCATINIEVAPSALGSLTIAPTASGTTASNWNLPSTPLPTVDTSNIDTTGLTNGEVLTIFTAPNTTVLSNETISVQTSARFTSELDGNLVKVAYIAGMPANFMHYDFDEGASSASDSGTAFDVGGENTDVTLVSSKNGKAIQVHTNFTPWWHTLANGTSPFHVGEVTVTTVAKLCETNIVLWGLGGSANANAMGLVATDANTVAVVVKNGSAIVETLATVTGANDLTKGWHSFAVVSDENGTTLYVDDLSVATAKSLPAGIGQQGQLGSFHGTPDGTGYNKVGASGYYLDDWRVYDAALTAKEIKALKRELNPDPLFIRLR